MAGEVDMDMHMDIEVEQEAAAAAAACKGLVEDEDEVHKEDIIEEKEREPQAPKDWEEDVVEAGGQVGWWVLAPGNTSTAYLGPSSRPTAISIGCRVAYRRLSPPHKEKRSRRIDYVGNLRRTRHRRAFALRPEAWPECPRPLR